MDGTSDGTTRCGTWVWARRAVGVYFAGSAVLNAVYTVRRATDLVAWFRDGAWLPPYRTVLGALVPVARPVVLATAAFEAVVGWHLLRGRRVNGALRWAQAWVLGLCPALPWPYWVPNVLSAPLFELVRRRATRRQAAEVEPGPAYRSSADRRVFSAADRSRVVPRS